MKHERPDAFGFGARRAGNWKTAQELSALLDNEYRPIERARDEAQRRDDDPNASALDFQKTLEIGRDRHIRDERMAAIDAVIDERDEAGALQAGPDSAEADEIVERAALAAERVHVDQNKYAVEAIDSRQTADNDYRIYRHESGAKIRQQPWRPLGHSCLALVCANTAEVVALSFVMPMAAVSGVPPGFVLALAFGFLSLLWGMLGALGTSLAADLRRRRKQIGGVIIFVAVAFWVLTAFAGAHFRVLIEAAAGVTGSEIWASMIQSPFGPFVSPLNLFLLGISGLATAITWIEWLKHLGMPLGNRPRDIERQHAHAEFHRVEASHRAEIMGTLSGATQDLENLEARATRPVVDGSRLEDELAGIAVFGRERIAMIVTEYDGIAAAYVATVRQLRRGVDVGNDMVLEPVGDLSLGDPKSLRERNERLAANAAQVSAKVAAGKAAIGKLEIEHLTLIDNLYGATRPGGAPPSGTGNFRRPTLGNGSRR